MASKARRRRRETAYLAQQILISRRQRCAIRVEIIRLLFRRHAAIFRRWFAAYMRLRIAMRLIWIENKRQVKQLCKAQRVYTSHRKSRRTCGRLSPLGA